MKTVKATFAGPRQVLTLIFAVSILTYAATGVASAKPPRPQKAEVERDLKHFDQHPLQFSRIPPRVRVSHAGHEIMNPFAQLPTPTAQSDLPGQELIPREVLDYRNRIRGEIIHGSEVGSREALHEQIEKFFDPKELSVTGGTVVKDLPTMETMKFTSIAVPVQPWSDTYWPMYQGVTGARYAADGFLQAGHNWPDFLNFISTAEPLSAIYQSQNGAAIDDLSPAEKYDLLIGYNPGDGLGIATSWNWVQGQNVYHQVGDVPRWMGICHGWAPASYMLLRPLHSVDTVAADGQTRLTFYPSDLKALASLLWANAAPKMHFIGSRCDVSSPAVDPSGHVLDEACFDVNPGIWHMTVVNQLASAQRNLVFDATYDLQVWNQPLLAYSYTYFNPKTKKVLPTFAQAVIPYNQYSNDHFRKFRSPEVANIVGIAMTVRYLVETVPTHTAVDSSKYDVTKDVTYYYDLELDENNQIIGGEWYQLMHPDFIWTPGGQQRAQSAFEPTAASSWDISQPLSPDWQAAGAQAAPYGQPLAKVVQALLKAAQ